MVRVNDRTISLGTLVAILALLGVGVAAWADVKSDVAVNRKATEVNEKSDNKIVERLERMEAKLDRLIERAIVPK